MRARQRHFNAGSAGAAACYDARFLALNNNDAVDSWTDRSGNGRNATQSTSTKKPTFQTGSIGGAPALSFDGGDCLVTSAFDCSPRHVTISVFVRSSTAGFVWEQGTNYTDNGVTFVLLNNTANFYSKGTGTYPTASSGKNVSGASSTWAAANTWYVLRTSCEGTNANHKAFSNGSEYTLVNHASEANDPGTSTYSLALNIGSRNNAATLPLNGKIAYIARLFNVPTDALRKRLEHSAAYSFKIACS